MNEFSSEEPVDLIVVSSISTSGASLEGEAAMTL
jgi:hypothetical protein